MASIWGSLGKVPDGSLKEGRIKRARMPRGSLGYEADNFSGESGRGFGRVGIYNAGYTGTGIVSDSPAFAASHRCFGYCAGPWYLSIKLVEDIQSPLFQNQVLVHTLSPFLPTVQEQHLYAQKVSWNTLEPPCPLHCHLLY